MAAAHAAVSKAQDKKTKPTSVAEAAIKEKKDHMYGRQIAGLPYLQDIGGMTVSMMDESGRKYYIYNAQTFPKLEPQRERSVKQSDETVFVVALPVGITRKVQGFGFPHVSPGDTMQFFDQTYRFAGVVSFIEFPPKGHATGFLHLRDLSRVAHSYPPIHSAPPSSSTASVDSPSVASAHK